MPSLRAPPPRRPPLQYPPVYVRFSCCSRSWAYGFLLARCCLVMVLLAVAVPVEAREREVVVT
eukprot:5929833-Pyramimonas_sp.AAC.1